MSKEYRMVEVCDNCGEMLEHCICEDNYCGEYGEYVCDGGCECYDCEELDDSEKDYIKHGKNLDFTGFMPCLTSVLSLVCRLNILCYT